MDLALVCVKSFDTEGAGRMLAPALAPGAVVLSLQNGVENPEILAAACPGAAVGGVAVYLGCQRIAPDHVVRRPSRDPATGRLRDLLAGGGPGPAGEALAAVGAAIGVPTRVDERPDVALWTKLVANASLNTVTALGRANVGRVFSDQRGRGADARARPRGGGGGPRPRRAGARRRGRGVHRRRPHAAARATAARPRSSTWSPGSRWRAPPWWAPSRGRASGCACPCRSAARAPPSWASWILPTVRFTLKP